MARTFLESSSKDIEIGPVVAQYLTVIREFYEWFAGTQETIHAADYATVNAKLAVIARARAPDVFASMREDADRVEAGVASAHDALARWMSNEDRLLLEQLLAANLPSWVDGALYRLSEHYGEIPEDIVTRFRNAVRV